MSISETAFWKRRMRANSLGGTPTCSRKWVLRWRRLQPSSSASSLTPRRPSLARRRASARVTLGTGESASSRRVRKAWSRTAKGSCVAETLVQARADQRVERDDLPRELVQRDPQQQVRADRAEVDLHAPLRAARLGDRVGVVEAGEEALGGPLAVNRDRRAEVDDPDDPVTRELAAAREARRLLLVGAIAVHVPAQPRVGRRATTSKRDQRSVTAVAGGARTPSPGRLCRTRSGRSGCRRRGRRARSRRRAPAPARSRRPCPRPRRTRRGPPRDRPGASRPARPASEHPAVARRAGLELPAEQPFVEGAALRGIGNAELEEAHRSVQYPQATRSARPAYWTKRRCENLEPLSTGAQALAPSQFRAMETHRSIVIVPSRTIDKFHEPAAETQAYEERLLCLIQVLRDPSLRLVYVTSSPVAAPTVDYCLRCSAAELVAEARARLMMLSADHAPCASCGEAAGAPELLTRIRAAIGEPQRGQLVPYVSTELERALGTRSTSRSTAPTRHSRSGDEERIPRAVRARRRAAPARRRADRRPSDAVAAIARLRARGPSCSSSSSSSTRASRARATRSSSSVGCPAGRATEALRIGERFVRDGRSRPTLARSTRISTALDGGVVEERIPGAELRSPSVQLNLTPDGEAGIVSTHDQLLGGQRYLGCRFPAEPAYASPITDIARRVGAARAGPERAAVRDRLRRRPRHSGDWHAYAIEVNLRAGGTTHPLAVPRAALRRRLRRRRRDLQRPRAARPATTSPPTISSRRACARSATAACSGSRRCRAWPPTAAASSSTC